MKFYSAFFLKTIIAMAMHLFSGGQLYPTKFCPIPVEPADAARGHFRFDVCKGRECYKYL
jgi:hypothetical protein